MTEELEQKLKEYAQTHLVTFDGCVSAINYLISFGVDPVRAQSIFDDNLPVGAIAARVNLLLSKNAPTPVDIKDIDTVFKPNI